MSAKIKSRRRQRQYQAVCPEKAFALPLILCTVSLRQSILTGILVVWLLLFCQLLNNMLCSWISERSRRAAVSVAAAAVSFSLFCVTDYAAGLRDAGQAFSFVLYWILTGLLTAEAVGHSEGETGWSESRLLTRSACLWAAMIVTGMIREFLAYGSILEAKLTSAPFQSAVFAGPAFGLIFAALVFACSDCGKQPGGEPFCAVLYPVAAILILCPPALGHGNALAARIAGVLAVFLFHASVRYRLASGDMPFSLLAESLMASGFFYMIL